MKPDLDTPQSSMNCPICGSDKPHFHDPKLIAALRAKDARIAELDKENDLIAQLGRDRIAALEADVARYAKARPTRDAVALQMRVRGMPAPEAYEVATAILALFDPPGDRP